MKRHIAGMLTAFFLCSSLSYASDKTKIEPTTAIQLASEQQGDDPVIGIWNGQAGGYNWQTAIVKNPNQARDGYEFLGVLLRPWPLFKKGEVHIYLNKSSVTGVYEGKEKWKSLVSGSWSGARFYLREANQLEQANNIGFSTPLGSNWTLLRQPIPETRALQSLKHSGEVLQTATVSESRNNDTVQSILFIWFDEEQPKSGSQVIEVCVTARAYEGVLSILREVRGKNTAVKSGSSVLDTNYHPPSFQLGTWISQQPSPEKLTSVFYWNDEVLGDTTPAMDFYMTRRAYENIMAVVQNHFAQIRAVQPLAPEKDRKLSSFLKVLGIVGSAALQGMANYYTTVRPVEEQRIALQRVVSAHETEAYAAQQQVWELQRLNQLIDQANTQRLLENLRRDGEEWGRMLQRYSKGSWPK
jgi:cell division protein FtsL